MAKYLDQNGQTQDVSIDVGVYREAQDAGMTVEAYLNQKHPVAEGDAPAFQQMLASTGIFLSSDPRSGIRASRLSDVLNGTTLGAAGLSNTRDAVPQSRILFPAAILSAVENKLARDLTTEANAIDKLVAVTDNIPGTTFQRVVTNYSRPESYRSRATSQLSKPAAMLTMTVNERTSTVPSQALGIEWSDQLAQATTLDVIALSVARQIAVERHERAQEDLLALLNGDEDVDQGPLSAVAGIYASAGQLDSSITEDGKLTQKAWVHWLYAGGNYRTIDWIITDLDGALAIENREGRPTVQTDNATSPRIDTALVVANPLIPTNVKVYVTRNPNWPAGTIMGIDSRYAIHRVNSLSANYQAVEQNVIRRANEMRWDSGTILYRQFDDAHGAYSVLELKKA